MSLSCFGIHFLSLALDSSEPRKGGSKFLLFLSLYHPSCIFSPSLSQLAFLKRDIHPRFTTITLFLYIYLLFHSFFLHTAKSKRPVWFVQHQILFLPFWSNFSHSSQSPHVLNSVTPTLLSRQHTGGAGAIRCTFLPGR